jgi:hypothetical protein
MPSSRGDSSKSLGNRPIFYFSTRHYPGMTEEKTSGRINKKETAA